MPTEILNKFFGYDKFRPAQAEIIDSILKGLPTLGILPTGGGKSLCYQIPALKMEGLSIVISPLISLMKDQVDSLVQNGIAADFFNSSQTNQEQSEVLIRLKSGQTKLLYVAPERIKSPQFLSALASIPVAMIAVDEAHCISQWGHDFRPSYQSIPQFIDRLPNTPLMTAFTATATPEVRADILEKLNIPQANTFVQGFDRPNLQLTVYNDIHKMDFIRKYLSDHKGQSGIIYANTRKKVEEISDQLKHSGIKTGKYHAGMEDGQRKKIQEDFIYERLDIIVATNAFGMGIDKSNVRFVIHHNMPRDIESYYQEAGRAGRDGEPAECILLYGGNDLSLQRYFLDMAREQVAPEILKKREEKLQEMVSYCHSQDCLRTIILTYFGERMHKPQCGNCSNCQDFEWEDVTQDSAIILSCVLQIKAGAATIAEILTGSQNQKIVRNGWHEMSSHAVMKGRKKEEIRSLINNLVSRQELEVTQGQFPVLLLTPKGREALKSGKQIKIKRFSSQALPVKEQIIERTLFDRLRHLRLTLSQKENVPPYVIFSDASLREMSQYLPVTKQDLFQISGVGEKKMMQYGELFLAMIQDYCEQNKKAATRPAVKRKKVSNDSLSPKVLEYLGLHRSGTSVDNIARKMDVQPSTVISNLLRCARQGKELDYSRLLSHKHEQEVMEVIRQKGYNLLKPIKESLAEDISYDTIRLVIQKNCS